MFHRLTFAVALFLGMPGALAAAPAANDPVIARVNGAVLHRSDFEAAERTLPPQAQKLPVATVYPILLEQLVDGELIAEAGRKEQLQKDPEVVAELKRDENRLIEHAYLARAIKAATTEASLKAQYQVFLKEHPPQEEVQARHILVKTKKEAEDIIAQLDKGADFATLAKKYSTDPGGKSGGDLGFFSKKQMVPAFADAAFALKAGTYTKTPVKSEFGWHVIKVEARRPGKEPSLAEARPQLENMIARSVINAQVKQLRSGAKIETFDLEGKPLAPEKK
ncbi:MAG TPA: peptidylprolyl isomerase [Stellaceae bacterium]|nr:peptidylprolyl isomerase [Stellaceae bacterium]